MFLPLGDDLPLARLPIITIALIAINVTVWMLGLQPAGQQSAGSLRHVSRHDVWLVEFGAVPCELLGRCTNQKALVVVDGGLLDPTPRAVPAQVRAHMPALTLLTSLFLHGGALHLIINMLYLWAFGRQVEDGMHRLSFLGLYLGAGIVASLAQAVMAPGATSPTIGASGAIAAVIGAYLLTYPRARVRTVLLIPFAAWLPAWLVAGGWGLLQIFGTWRSLLAPTALAGNVADTAHLTGFVLGALCIPLLLERRNRAYDTQMAGESSAEPDS